MGTVPMEMGGNGDGSDFHEKNMEMGGNGDGSDFHEKNILERLYIK